MTMDEIWRFKTGNKFLLWINGGWRIARVLYGNGKQALVEYEMPCGTSALRIYRSKPYRSGKDYRRVSYCQLPEWLLPKLVGIDWIGYPQSGNIYGPPALDPKTGLIKVPPPIPDDRDLESTGYLYTPRPSLG